MANTEGVAGAPLTLETEIRNATEDYKSRRMNARKTRKEFRVYSRAEPLNKREAMRRLMDGGMTKTDAAHSHNILADEQFTEWLKHYYRAEDAKDDAEDWLAISRNNLRSLHALAAIWIPPERLETIDDTRDRHPFFEG